jgi:hypothetical protein
VIDGRGVNSLQRGKEDPRKRGFSIETSELMEREISVRGKGRASSGRAGDERQGGRYSK